MKRILACGLFLVMVAASAHARARGYTYHRVYHPGDTSSYQLTTDTFHNDTLSSESVAQARVRVVSINGVPFDQVAFLGLKETNDPAAGAFKQLNAYAAQVKPFDISLAPGGSMAIPSLKVPHMTGPITDLVTYWVAVSAKAGIDALHAVGDTHAVSRTFGGTWANGSTTPVGHDELRVIATLVAEDAGTATFRTDFLPPRAEDMTMAYPWMQKPLSAGTPNNFEQVVASGNGTFLAMWGTEDFTITTVVKKDSGVIEHAAMTDHLNLRMRVRCDAALQACGPELPYSITRKEVLALLPAK